MPVTMPVVEAMDAMEGLLLLQVPPVVASVSVVAELRQAADEPEMAAGGVPTATVVVPVMVFEQAVDAFVATTPYVPAAVKVPKSRVLPVPLTVTTGIPPLFNK